MHAWTRAHALSLADALEHDSRVVARLAFTALVALAYFLSAQLGMWASIGADKVACVWPPSGLALALLLLYGWRALPGLVIGSLGNNLSYVNGMTGIDAAGLWVAVTMSSGSLVQAVLAAALCRRVLGVPDVSGWSSAGSNRSTWRYIGVVALSCCVAATFGTISLAARQVIQSEHVATNWLAWWVGDTAGMLVFAPPLLWWRHRLAMDGSATGAAGRVALQDLPGAHSTAFPIVCIGIGMSMMAAFIVGHLERQSRVDQFQHEANTLAVALEKNLTLSQRDLQSLQSLYYKVSISRDEFLATVKPLVAHHAWQRSFGWARWIRQSARTAFEADASGDGLGGLNLRERDAQGRLVVAAQRPDYLPVVSISPSGTFEHLVGVDLLQLSGQAPALHQSLRDGNPIELHLQGLAAEGGTRTTLVMLWPVRAGALETGAVRDTRPVIGMSLAQIDLESLLATTCKELRCAAETVLLFDKDQPDAALASLAPARGVPSEAAERAAPALRIGLQSATAGLHAGHDITLNNLRLRLVQRPDAASLRWSASRLQVGVLLSGLLFTSMLAAYLAQRRRATELTLEANQRLEGQVAQRTLELSNANKALQAQVQVRRTAEEALRRFRWFAESAGQGLGMADFERRTVYLNPTLRALAGVKPGAVVEGTDMLDHYPAARRSHIVDTVWPALRAGGSWTGELRLDPPRHLRPDGPPVTHLIESYFVLRNEAGAPQLVASIMTDISALKQLEAQVERARAAAEEANQAKSVFLANMSHEIRTPLNAVLGYTQLMREDLTLAPAHRERLGSVLSAGQRLLGLINDILDLSKIEAGAMTLFARPFNLRTELAELADLMRERAESRGLDFQLSINLPDPAPVVADRAKVGQMLLNLLGNAIKFTERGSVGLKVWHDGSALCFEVSDSGPGISDAELQTLFAPFRQGDSGQAKGGTGLGLSITRRLARLMDGDLALVSQPGHGTQALLRLPLPYTTDPVKPDASAARGTGAVRLLSPSTLNILVVEDDADSRTVLCDLLRGLGCTITVAGQGAEALDLIAADGLPDAVFTDIRMPVMTGLELLGALRSNPQYAHLPVIAVSASSMEHQRAHFLAEGFDDFVGKPYAFADIYRMLELHAGATLGERPTAESLSRPAALGKAESRALQSASSEQGVGSESLRPADRAELLALARASSDGAMAQARSHFAKLAPERLGALHAEMSTALAHYDLERVEHLARHILDQVPNDLPPTININKALP